MKKKSIILLLISFITLSGYAQKAKQLFRAMPDSIIPILTANNRADCTDFMDSKMKAEVTNAFKEKTTMTDMTDDYISLNLSASSRWQMKVLPTDVDSIKIICVVNSVDGPATDSRIEFYTTTWKPCDANEYITLPTMDDFFKAPSTTDENDSTYIEYTKLHRQCDICLMKIDLNKTDYSLNVTFTTPEYLEKDTAKKIKPFLRDSILYRWKGNKFVKE